MKCPDCKLERHPAIGCLDGSSIDPTGLSAEQCGAHLHAKWKGECTARTLARLRHIEDVASKFMRYEASLVELAEALDATLRLPT